MKRNDELSAFIRFRNAHDMRKVMHLVKDGDMDVCGMRVRDAEVARQNTASRTIG